MSGTNPRSQDFPQYHEHLDKRDIRNTFRMPCLDGPITLEKQKSSDWPPKFSSSQGYNPNFPIWGGFQKLSMCEARFNEDDMMSETSSNGSAGSNGSGRRKFTRGPRIHHIPILGSRDDSSGYSSDTPPEDTTSATLDKGRTGNSHRQSFTISVTVESSVNNHTHHNYNFNTPDYNHQGGFQKPHAQRSMFDQQFGSAQDHREQHPKKSSSQPPRSPPAPEKGPTPGPFLTRVKLNAPAPLVEGESAIRVRPSEEKVKKPKHNPKEQINSILGQMEGLKKQVEEYKGTTKDKNYRFLDEMLTRLLLKLDDVDTSDQDIHMERKNAVKQILSCKARLTASNSAYNLRDEHSKQNTKSILEEMNNIKARVLDFRGITKDCNYNYLVEKLTLLLVKLDEMDSGGQDDVRLERKKAVQAVKSCLALLEQRMAENQITAGKG